MKVYTDAARDDEVAGMGWRIVLDSGEVIEDNRYMLGDYTSMECEYYALLDGLRMAKRHGADEIEIYTDCKPLIEKMRAPDATSQTWYDRHRGCRRLLNKFDDWTMQWTPRTSNTGADQMAYKALEAGRQS